MTSQTYRKPVRKAVFPVAGLGTRFLPATKAIPKEMLPIIDRPLIQYAVDEANEAGIEHAPLIARRRIVRAEVARIYGELRQRYDGEGLSALAGRTWAALYGATLTPIALAR